MHLKYDGEPFDVQDMHKLLSLKLAQNVARSMDYVPIQEDGFTNHLIVTIK